MRDWTRRGILAGAAMLPGWRAGAAHAEALAGVEAFVPDTETLPPIRFTTADGTGKTLADYAGRPVLLNFWATWCMPCVAELPALNRLAAARPDLAVLPLSSDRQGAPVVSRFYEAHGIDHLPLLLDPRGDAQHALAARGIPTTLAIARDGRVVARAEGGVGWDSEAVAAWLGSHLG